MMPKGGKKNGQRKYEACALPVESSVGWIPGTSPRMTVPIESYHEARTGRT